MSATVRDRRYMEKGFYLTPICGQMEAARRMYAARTSAP
jgi:hypothetical protein